MFLRSGRGGTGGSLGHTMYTLAFLVEGLSFWHLLILGAVMLLVFGRRLPEVGRNLGKGITEFKKGIREASDEVMHDDQARQSQQSQQPRAYMPPPQQQQNYSPRLPQQQGYQGPAQAMGAGQSGGARTSRADLVD